MSEELLKYTFIVRKNTHDVLITPRYEAMIMPNSKDIRLEYVHVGIGDTALEAIAHCVSKLHDYPLSEEGRQV